MEPIAITDDEAVGLAVMANSVWPSLLPSVDVNDEAELGKAAQRGIRSLFVRGLARITDGELPTPRPDLLDLVRPILDRKTVFGTYLGDEKLQVAGVGVASFVYGDATAARSEVVTELGVHYLSMTTLEEAKAAVASMVAAVYEEGLSMPQTLAGQVPELGLCALGPAGDTVPAVYVSKGRIVQKSMDVASSHATDVTGDVELGRVVDTLLKPAA